MNLFNTKKVKKYPSSLYPDDIRPGKPIVGKCFDMVPVGGDNLLEYKMVVKETMTYRKYDNELLLHINPGAEGGIFEFSDNEAIRMDQLLFIDRNQKAATEFWIDEKASVRGNVIPKGRFVLLGDTEISNKSDSIPILTEDVRLYNTSCVRDIPIKKQLSQHDQDYIRENGGGLYMAHVLSEYSEIVDKSNTIDGAQINFDNFFKLKWKLNEITSSNLKYVYSENSDEGGAIQGSELQGVYLSGLNAIKGTHLQLHQADNMLPESFPVAVKDAQFMKHIVLDSSIIDNFVDTDMQGLVIVDSTFQKDSLPYELNEEYTLLKGGKLHLGMTSLDVREYAIKCDSNTKNHCLTDDDWFVRYSQLIIDEGKLPHNAGWSVEESALDEIRLDYNDDYSWLYENQDTTVDEVSSNNGINQDDQEVSNITDPVVNTSDVLNKPKVSYKKSLDIELM